MLPPDRSHILTEQRNPRTAALHTASVADCIALINQEDRTIPDAMAHAAPALARFIEAVDSHFLAGGRLIYIGAGTSGRLGVLDASEAPPTFCVPPDRIIGLIAGGDSALRKSSESKEDIANGSRPELEALNLTEHDTILAIAAGGTTPYAVGALAVAKSLAAGCTTGLLTCSPVPTPPHCDYLIVIPTGPELLTGSTRMKAGTATKLALNTISTTLMIRSGRVYQNLMVDVRATNAKLRDRAARIITALTGVPRDAAFTLLDRAEGSTKVAIVMHKRNVDRATAEQCLATANGRLDGAID